MGLLSNPSSSSAFQAVKLEFLKPMGIIFPDLFKTLMANRLEQYLKKGYFMKENLKTRNHMEKAWKRRKAIITQGLMRMGQRFMGNLNGTCRILNLFNLMKEISKTICFMVLAH